MPNKETELPPIYIGSRQLIKWFATVVAAAATLLSITATYIIHNIDSTITATAEQSKSNTDNISELTTVVSIIAADDKFRAEEIANIITIVTTHLTNSESDHDKCRHRITILERDLQHLNFILKNYLPRIPE